MELQEVNPAGSSLGSLLRGKRRDANIFASLLASFTVLCLHRDNCSLVTTNYI